MADNGENSLNGEMDKLANLIKESDLKDKQQTEPVKNVLTEKEDAESGLLGGGSNGGTQQGGKGKNKKNWRLSRRERQEKVAAKGGRPGSKTNGPKIRPPSQGPPRHAPYSRGAKKHTSRGPKNNGGPARGPSPTGPERALRVMVDALLDRFGE